MTQPPSQQPPQGGFGTPQNPPSGPPNHPPAPPAPASGAPQPPAGPPQGAPQTTPPPGQGAPPQNPPQAPGTPPAGPPAGAPGYGFPQAPGQPPAQPAGYGYPQAPGQPAGYGYPQAPGQGQVPGQPPGQAPYGYGYPTQPMPPQPAGSGSPAGPGGGRKLSAQVQIIIAAAVAIVLIIGSGVAYSLLKDDAGGGKKDEAENSADGGAKGGGEDGGGNAPDGPGKEKAPDSTAAKVAFQLPQPEIKDLTDVVGSWVTDKAFIKPGVESISAYDPAKGNELWKLPLPGQICAASRHVTEDNKTAIAFEAEKRTPPKNYQQCTEIGVIDLSTGKLLWSKSVTGGSSGDEKARFSEVTLSGKIVAAGDLSGGAAFDLDSGKVLWKPKVDTNQCRDIGYGGGPALVAVRRCGSYDDSQVSIQMLKPDGSPQWSYDLPAGVDDARIVSSDPLVVAADVGDTGTFGISDFFSIDGKTGKLRAKIVAPGDKYLARCSASDGVEGCQFVAVGNDRIYLPTEEHDAPGEDYGRTNEIVSFDLATGKATADRADAGPKYTLYPLRMDGGNLIAYKYPPYNKGGQIVSIDGATFKQTVLLENPADRTIREAETSRSVNGTEYLYRNGTFYVSADRLSTSSSSGKRYLAVVFTTNN
ncbi:PQQ-binding-like beta-propeller repeat protein [Streptomyces sp. HNM0663]|uniref:PQQ-binding-like beta-propeller repeat protein n=1 Tax=Streptomyces chengmaiensis TaxID=3040919 RepID=A0ABT6HK72_9ACTN|nr:PQQ-binding-like beta-propeller repeat protein [Streptomyces chengmaiensis]MDH2389142.1 PQQ-binding-like beta-propeller repeat protein [Streptomyces chengmaiensis]